MPPLPQLVLDDVRSLGSARQRSIAAAAAEELRATPQLHAHQQPTSSREGSCREDGRDRVGTEAATGMGYVSTGTGREPSGAGEDGTGGRVLPVTEDGHVGGEGILVLRGVVQAGRRSAASSGCMRAEELRMGDVAPLMHEYSKLVAALGY